ncbi:P protein-like [Dermacentor albipictus]|uniref:P protein-like n=1 Tax=Dermacentor albipictus TaxID=60249 RepID=UPI0038FC17EC
MATARAGESISGSRIKGPAARLSAALDRAASVSVQYVRSTAGVVARPADHAASSPLIDGMELSDRTESCRLAVPDETSPLLAFPATGVRPRRCSSLGSRDDAPEADAEVVDEEKPQVSARQLWLHRAKTGVLSLVVVFAVVVMSFIPELTETWTSVAINGNESYLHNLSLLLEPGHPVVRVRARGPFISEELGNLSGLWTVFTLEGSAEPPVRVPTAPPPLQPTPVQWEHLFPLPRDSVAQRQPLGGYALEVHLESSSDVASVPQVSLSVDVSAFTELTQLGLLMGGAVLLGLYVLIVFELVHRTLAAMLAATAAIACLALIGDRPSLAKVMSWLDVETLCLLFGMMVLVAILCETGFFDYAAVVAFRVARGQVWPLVTTLCATTALVSAFLDNVTTILLMTPATIKLCEVMDLDPKLILIWLVIFSNIGGAATPVGDPPNVIIISNPQVAAMGINFTSFTAHMVPGALLCLAGAYLLLRLRDTKSLRPHEAPELLELQRELDIWRKAYRSLSEYSRDEKHVKDILERKVKRLERLRSRKAADLRCTEEGFRQNLQLLSDKYKIRNRGLLVKTGIVLGCVIVLFFMQSFPNLHLSLGWIAVLGALLLLVLADLDDLEPVMARVEWTTLVFFAALFVVMEALGELQLIYFIGQRTQEWIGALRPQSQRPVAILIVTWVSALASSLMDNIPFTTAMVKVVTGLSEGPALVYALAWGACLGGNGTLIGASANVVCAGVAEQHGHRFTFFDFFRIGFPVMLLTTSIASLWLLFCHVWLQWNT